MIYILIINTGCVLRNGLQPEMPITNVIEFNFLKSTSHNRTGKIKGYYVAQGDKAVIYKEDGIELPLYMVNKILQDLDYNWDEFVNIYGDISDLDNNGKIVFFFFDFQSNNTAAFVSYANAVNSVDLGDWVGEIVYMNTRTDRDLLLSTVYHELVHLACYTATMNNEHYGIGSHTSWLYEAIAQSGKLFVDKPQRYTDITSSYHYQSDYSIGTMLFNNLYIDSGYNKNIFKDILNMINTSTKDRIRNVIKKYEINSEIDYNYILNRLPDNGRLNK